MKVKLPQSGTIIISQDAIWMQENLDGYPAGLNYSVQDYTNSVNRLKFMRDLEGAQMFMAHDGDQYKAKGARVVQVSPLRFSDEEKPPDAGGFFCPFEI